MFAIFERKLGFFFGGKLVDYRIFLIFYGLKTNVSKNWITQLNDAVSGKISTTKGL